MATFPDIHGKTLFFAFILTLLILMCFGSSSVEAQGGQLPRDEGCRASHQTNLKYGDWRLTERPCRHGLPSVVTSRIRWATLLLDGWTRDSQHTRVLDSVVVPAKRHPDRVLVGALSSYEWLSETMVMGCGPWLLVVIAYYPDVYVLPASFALPWIGEAETLFVFPWGVPDRIVAPYVSVGESG
ncbi:hypothetical protein CK203_040125 [Vitis vinifera]|uniref:Uncharacterized protein n=1 Tax=Vitis vinifera TaxID=29760 RepID=A0A438H3D5_VITVI|nr:hypothetical protein CK203_040125 [Vitis vinifera]